MNVDNLTFVSWRFGQLKDGSVRTIGEARNLLLKQLKAMSMDIDDIISIQEKENEIVCYYLLSDE